MDTSCVYLYPNRNIWWMSNVIINWSMLLIIIFCVNFCHHLIFIILNLCILLMLFCILLQIRDEVIRAETIRFDASKNRFNAADSISIPIRWISIRFTAILIDPHFKPYFPNPLSKLYCHLLYVLWLVNSQYGIQWMNE